MSSWRVFVRVARIMTTLLSSIRARARSLWTNRYNGPGNTDDYANALGVDTNDNVFVSGSSIGIGGHSDYATIKYSSAACHCGPIVIHGPVNGDDYANALALDASGNACS